ncbi:MULTISPECIES: hypothetical protein [Methylobacterium]|jgi:hypothetical protein|uniref:hypothetical protein n=1 Tax=Methylobacterium TaxID=407 RepID=UPI0003489272|nr:MULTISPECIES: hypothetical protein [Methylobacterium]KQS81915.1 hypothetical protein ASG32_04000 [Methylobacterium sp. Leaf361]MBN4094362.1 hypothetical protein [Methylobacterium sp. OT2]UIN33219.1 hypothetical protein LXM90_19250 [Methylobacterium oryzae]SEG25606.1 hypothetical protein SAMN04488144_11281 [Methylobacterium sp. 190mf]SEH76076.1 hypothetical protein SAMN02799636_03760 [Methylobacterium sp. 275MFSha3.1]
MRLVPERSLRAFRRRGLATAALALFALTAGPAYAQREDQGLQLGCANDYFRLCAGVDPNSQDADRCMMRNRKRLSPECRAAIGDYDKRTGSKSLSDD